MIYYLNKEMGITVEAEKWLDVSFAKILAYYLVVLQYIRKYEDNKYHRIRQEDKKQICSNLSYMAMGMACICGLKDENEQAEDFLLFSKIADSKLEKKDICIEIKENLERRDRDGLQILLKKIMDGESN